MKSELDLFESPPIQKSILKTEEVVYKPIASLDNASTIEFVSLGHGDAYRDLSSVYLRLKIKILKESNGAKHSDNTAGVANNILSSLFRQVTVYLNNKPISQADHNFSYRAYIENLLNYGSDASSTHLASCGWVLDSGKLDDLTDAKNPGLDIRKKLFGHGEVVEVMGKVHCDMFNQNKLLLNNVDLRVVFSLEKPEFYMMEVDSNTSFMVIMDASLHMNHATINPNILYAHQHLLEKNNAIYPYKRVEVKSYTISKGTSTLSIDNVALGVLPNILLFAMVDNQSYTGTRNLNPFNFKNNDISSFNLIVNGVQYPNKPLEFDYTKYSKISTRGYNSLFHNIGIKHSDRGIQITKKQFDNGFFILAFDLTADHSYNSSCGNLLNDGNIRIEGRFTKALPETITCIVYTEYDAVVEINKERNVFTSF